MVYSINMTCNTYDLQPEANNRILWLNIQIKHFIAATVVWSCCLLNCRLVVLRVRTWTWVRSQVHFCWTWTRTRTWSERNRTWTWNPWTRICTRTWKFFFCKSFFKSTCNFQYVYWIIAKKLNSKQWHRI